MRFHRLTLDGVGSFAHRQTIDFDKLGSQGLFLIHGDTGAGKSTILDALFCALYGEVPGGKENNKRRMVSWYLPGKKHPVIILDFSAGTKFYRLTRTIWIYTPEGNATGHKAKLEEFDNESYSNPIRTDSGIDPVYHRVVEILGLRPEHFEQTVMLPQGKAQEFLVSNGTGRFEVLQNLFKSDIYTQLEQRVKELQKQNINISRRYHEAQIERLTTIVSNLRHHPVLDDCEVDLSALLDRVSPATKAKSDEAPRVFETLFTQMNSDLNKIENYLLAQKEKLETRRQDSEKTTEAAMKQLLHAQVSAQKIRTAHDLAQKLDTLQSQNESMTELDRQNTLALAAAKVVDAQEKTRTPRQEARAKLEDISTLLSRSLRQDSCLEPLGKSAEALQLDNLETWLTQKPAMSELNTLISAARVIVQNQQVKLRDVEISLAKLEEQQQKNQETGDKLASLRQEKTRLDQQDQQLHQEYETRRQQLETDRKLQDSLPDLERQKTTADKQLQQAEELEKNRQEARQLLAKSTAENTILAEKARQAQSTLDAWMKSDASRLAQRLQPGQPCPVCGSREHPLPATPTPQQTDFTTVEAANQALSDQQQHCHELDKRLSALQGEIQGLEKNLAGKNLTDLRVNMTELAQRLEQARQAEKEYSGVKKAVLELEVKIRENLSLISENLQQQAALAASLETGSAQAKQFEAEIARSLGELPENTNAKESATTLLRTNKQLAEMLDTLELLTVQWASLRERWWGAQNHLTEVLAQTGYETVAQARLDFKNPDALAADLNKVSQWKTDLNDTRNQLKPIADLATQAIPDLCQLEEIHAKARQELQDLQHDEAELTLTLETMRTGLQQIISAQTQWQKESHRLDTINELAAALSGAKTKGPSLTSSYLSSRLKQVITIANNTVRDISNGYLQIAAAPRDYDDTSRSGDGLGIRIYNAAEDCTSSPRALSGGEKFYCSLAIALALSQIVQAERGGIELENIFIDEGFGSLDDATRDTVIETLQRIYGYKNRSVGIISHVKDLKDDIPVQMEVTNYQSGQNNTAARALKGSYLRYVGVD